MTSYDDGMNQLTQLLSSKDYAALVGASERTVKRWLAEDLLAGAEIRSGRWFIPASTPRPELVSGPTTTVVMRDPRRPAARSIAELPPRAAASDRPTLASMLDGLPALVPVESAAPLLGVSAWAIRRHPERFEAVPWGAQGALLVPQSVIRRLAGL